MATPTTPAMKAMLDAAVESLRRERDMSAANDKHVPYREVFHTKHGPVLDLDPSEWRRL